MSEIRPEPRSDSQGGVVPDGLVEAFWDYEQALMSNDLAALDRLFAPSPDTLRGDAAGLLVGHDMISAFRGGRGGAPPRRIVELHVRAVDEDHALVVAITELLSGGLPSGGRGQQTQLWARLPQGWAVTAAHVSASPPALDTRVWRVVGDPLVPPTSPGPLSGVDVAVKDLYAVAGHRVGAGNPTWLAEAPVETEHAWAVARLLGAGAAVRGIARTDEFAYSLAGTNVHTGAPPNPRAPHRLSGGSTSGSASAVSLGHAVIGLGTDTGGSIRVPAAYQGLFGIRTTHGAVPLTGVLPLAPSFDAVGWLARDAATLRAVGDVLLPPGRDALSAPELVVVPGLLALAAPEVADAVMAATEHWPTTQEDWPLDDLPSWLTAFQTLQAWEAWQVRGTWLDGRLDHVGADVRGRFEAASRIDDGVAADAGAWVAEARGVIRDLVGDRVLVLPSASSVAPHLRAGDPGALQAVRDATMALTCLAGIGGLPAVSLPTTTGTTPGTTTGAAGDLPCGVCLVAAPGRDRELLHLAAALTA
ncbi:AtzH-like domain-containing protein [Nocardioides pacificus]